MTVFDTDVVEADLQGVPEACRAEIAKGNIDYYQAYADRLRELLQALETAEADAVRRATRRR